MKYIYAVCFLLLVCGCHKENDTPVVLPARTLLVYLGGDNNLDAETYDKLVQIKNGWEDGTDGNIIVYQDTPFKDSPRLMEIDGKSEKGYITIHTYDQENSASPQVLKRVINDVTRLYPAKSYGLIVFSHGSGWLPPHTLVNGSRSIIIDNDNISVLTDTANPRRYWSDLKRKLKIEGAVEVYEKIVQLKLLSPDGKKRLTDVANTEQLLRIIQSIPSKKAEPFKAWLAMVGKERIEETIDPEQAIDRALDTYLKKGYSEEWIHQRLLAIRIRNELTDEWKKRGVQKGKEYAILTDEISRAWSGMTTGQYKRLKGLTKENLRDNMTDLELVLTMLAEASTTDISKTAKPQTFEENKQVAKRGGKVAGIARQALEAETGKPVITEKNAFDFQQLVTDIVEDAAELPENPTEKKDKD